MIDYNPHAAYGYQIVFMLSGSVVPRNVPKALLGALVALLVGYLAGEDAEPLSYNPYGERVSCTVLGMLPVFRAAFAMQRWWEARSALSRMASLMTDVGRDAKSFSVKDIANPTEKAIAFQVKIARLLRLLLSVIFQNLTSKTEMCNWRAHEYVEEQERHQLKFSPRTRPDLVSVWILEEFMKLHNEKQLAVPPPALNNAIREVADVNLYYHKALQIADTQFPFPMIQMSKILLFFFLLVTPIVLGHNPGPHWQNSLLTFIVILSFFSVDSIGIELSDPFGDDENDLPLTDIMEDFNKYLSIVLPRQRPDGTPNVPPKADSRADFYAHKSFDDDKKRIRRVSVRKAVVEETAAATGQPSPPSPASPASSAAPAASSSGVELESDMRLNPLYAATQGGDSEAESGTVEQTENVHGTGEKEPMQMWYDMATGETYDYKANENCIIDDSEPRNGPESPSSPVVPPPVQEEPGAEQKDRWYDMSSGETYDFKANENCVPY